MVRFLISTMIAFGAVRPLLLVADYAATPYFFDQVPHLSLVLPISIITAITIFFTWNFIDPPDISSTRD